MAAKTGQGIAQGVLYSMASMPVTASVQPTPLGDRDQSERSGAHGRVFSGLGHAASALERSARNEPLNQGDAVPCQIGSSERIAGGKKRGKQRAGSLRSRDRKRSHLQDVAIIGIERRACGEHACAIVIEDKSRRDIYGRLHAELRKFVGGCRDRADSIHFRRQGLLGSEQEQRAGNPINAHVGEDLGERRDEGS